MLGLGVLYTTLATEEPEWGAIPERDRAARLREVYWARRAESEVGGGRQLVSAGFSWRADRPGIGRAGDDPGDAFIYLANFADQRESQFAWIEVTEVFTAMPPREVNDAMRAWHGISGKRQVDFQAFRNSLPMGRPSKAAQRSAADQVVQQIRRKLDKASYQDPLERYGRGYLVVGMPLWFATPPDHLGLPKGAADDFWTRMDFGLKAIEQSELARPDCPFRKVMVVWEPSSLALRTWREKRSVEYERLGSLRAKEALFVWMFDELPELLEERIPNEVDLAAASIRLTLRAEAPKGTGTEVAGNGPFPDLVQAMEKFVHEAPIN